MTCKSNSLLCVYVLVDFSISFSELKQGWGFDFSSCRWWTMGMPGGLAPKDPRGSRVRRSCCVSSGLISTGGSFYSVTSGCFLCLFKPACGPAGDVP